MNFIDLPPEKKIDNFVWNWKSHLGSGAYGKVYLGKDKDDPKKLVAIKIIETSTLDDEYLSKSLKNEIDIMKELDSANIVKLYNVFFTKNNVYIVTEFCNGGDLRSFFQKDKGPLPEEKARVILKDIVIGFKELVKRKIIHRDLKPENIMIHDNVFKLGDFGFSKHVNNFKSQMLTTLVGTPLYMAPQILKHESYTTKCDIWSLGLIYYEMLFGKTPWPARSQYELVMNITSMPLKFPYNVQISETSKSFLKKCLELSEEDRFSWDQLFDHKIIREPTSKITLYNRLTTTLEMDAKLKEIIQNFQKELQEKKLSSDELFKGSLNVGEFVDLMRKFVDYPKEQLEFLFFKFDQNGDNCLSREEFKILLCENDYVSYEMYEDPFLEEKAEKILRILSQAIKKNKLEIDKVFKCFDKKKSNKLDIFEFKELLQVIDHSISEKESEYVFKKIDKDNSGNIDKTEFRTVIENVLKKWELEEKNLSALDEKANFIIESLREIIFKKAVDIKLLFMNFDKKNKGEIPIDKFQELINFLNPKLSANEIKYVFDKLDLNGNKFIDSEEFLRILTI